MSPALRANIENVCFITSESARKTNNACARIPPHENDLQVSNEHYDGGTLYMYRNWKDSDFM